MIGVKLVGAPEVVEHLRDRTPALGIPVVLGKLVVADFAAVSVPALGHAKVHAYR